MMPLRAQRFARGELWSSRSLLVLLWSMFLAACDTSTVRHHRRSDASPSAESDAKSKGRLGHDADLPPDPHGDHSDQTPLPTLSLTPETIVWKRYRAFEDSLVQGLALDKSKVCNELGQHSCIDKVHLTVLGGNEPYTMGQYEAARTPTVLTGVAVDRVVLAACGARLTIDQGLNAGAVVFKAFPLNGAEVSIEQAKAQGATLYQRLLARDASAGELQVAAEILKIVRTPDKVALALCYVIGSQIENIFL